MVGELFAFVGRSGPGLGREARSRQVVDAARKTRISAGQDRISRAGSICAYGWLSAPRAALDAAPSAVHWPSLRGYACTSRTAAGRHRLDLHDLGLDDASAAAADGTRAACAFVNDRVDAAVYHSFMVPAVVDRVDPVDPLVNQVCRVNLSSQCQRGPDRPCRLPEPLARLLAKHRQLTGCLCPGAVAMAPDPLSRRLEPNAMLRARVVPAVHRRRPGPDTCARANPRKTTVGSLSPIGPALARLRGSHP